MDDVRQKDHIKYYSMLIPQIDVLKVACVEPSLPRDIELMSVKCSLVVKGILFGNYPALHGFKPWLFISDETWQPKSKLIRHKKLWKRLEIDFSLNEFQHEEEVEFESDKGLRYATIAEVTVSNVITAIQILRSKRSSALIFSNKCGMQSRNNIRSIFELAFTKEKGIERSMINWPNLIANLCPTGDLVIKAGGSYDEREIYVNFFGTSDKINLLKSNGSNKIKPQ